MIKDKNYIAIRYKKEDDITKPKEILKIVLFELEEKTTRNGFIKNAYNAKNSYASFKRKHEDLNFIVRKLKETETLESILLEYCIPDSSVIDYAETLWIMYKLVGYNVKLRKWA